MTPITPRDDLTVLKDTQVEADDVDRMIREGFHDFKNFDVFGDRKLDAAIVLVAAEPDQATGKTKQRSLLLGSIADLTTLLLVTASDSRIMRQALQYAAMEILLGDGLVPGEPDPDA